MNPTFGAKYELRQFLHCLVPKQVLQIQAQVIILAVNLMANIEKSPHIHPKYWPTSTVKGEIWSFGFYLRYLLFSYFLSKGEEVFLGSRSAIFQLFQDEWEL